MGLYAKMHAIMCESEALEKNMTVGDPKKDSSYKAISEAAVLNGIKPLLKKHGVILFPVKVDITEDFKQYAGKYGETQRFNSIVKAQYKIVDIETGESELLETVGYGTDSQDKGSGKAMTYAYKALLQKSFCLFSGEDTDNTHSDDLEKSNSKQTTDTTEKQELSAKITVTQLEEAMAKKGVTKAQIFATYKKETTKACSDLKYLPQEYKEKYFNMCQV